MNANRAILVAISSKIAALLYYAYSLEYFLQLSLLLTFSGKNLNKSFFFLRNMRCYFKYLLSGFLFFEVRSDVIASLYNFNVAINVTMRNIFVP